MDMVSLCPSLASLGEMLLNGQGCGKEEGLGLQWLKRSAEGGCVHGTGLLALHYYTRKLFSKAAEMAFRYKSFVVYIKVR